MSKAEVLDAAQKSSILRGSITREQTLQSEAALLKTKQYLATLAEGKGVSPEFIATLRTVQGEATAYGRHLQSLTISADPTLKTELVNHERYSTRGQARASVFNYIEAFYNRRRLHSTLGYLSPEAFERARTNVA